VIVLLLALLAATARAGLGPDDVVVLFNADDPEAAATADLYAAARDLDPSHLCGVTGVDPALRTISLPAAVDGIVAPFQACVDALPNPEDIDAVVIVRGLPYRVDLPDGGFHVSLDAAIQIAGASRPSDGAPLLGQPQARQGSLPLASIPNPVYIQGGNYAGDMTASFGASAWYATSPRIVRGEGVPGPYTADDDPLYATWDFGRALYVVSRLDGFDHTDARALIDRALAADGSFPDAPFLCMRGAEGARGVRDAECEHALRMLAAQGHATEWVSAHDAALGDREVIAYFTGAADLKGAIDGLTYPPGAVVENITSFGAAPNNFFCSADGATCPASESQTSIARMIRAGATAAHGTVAEPLNNVFPNAGFLTLYAQGYTLGESFLYNQRFLYWQNLYLGDPLTAPFAERPQVALRDRPSQNHPVLEAVSATHPDGVARVAIWLDGHRVDPVQGAWPTFDDLGLVEGDAVEVLAVATAAPPPPASVAGWPATAPVGFNPGTKGWTRAILTIGAPFTEEPDPEPPDDRRGCGCAALGPGAAWPALVAMGALVGRRRRAARP
jgi:uncharacterized protein (TIGR03790 family)